MDFVDLETRLRAARIDVNAELERFRAQTPHASADVFLGYLHARGVIGTQLFKELHTADVVETSATVVKPSERLAGTAGPVVPAANGAVIELETADYEVLGELGKGAMGEVHLARDVVLHRKVALKSILPQMQQHPALYSRFLAEMQITAQLDHPSIVPVYGVDNGPRGQLAYAMKLVQGQELETVLAETRERLLAGKPLDGPHSLEARLESFLKVCDAIAYAHERGVVHRDIKPSNVMIGRFNEVYVMDWGIAKLVNQSASATEAGLEVYDSHGEDMRQASRTRIGSTIGTPIYMSPEQAAGRVDELDGRSDQYALGLMLQEIVTLKPAVAGSTLDEVLTKAKTATRVPTEAPRGAEEVPRELRAIIDKATRLAPADRYPSVSALAADVRRFLRNEAVLAQPDTAGQRAGRWISKHRMLTAALLMVAVALGALASTSIYVYNRVKLAAKHNREVGLVELTASSGLRAQGLDARLQHYERQMSRLSGAIGLASQSAVEPGFYTSEAFVAGPNAPSGLTQSTFYGKTVSLDWPVGAIAPGASLEDAARLGVGRTLATASRPIMVDSLGDAGRALTDEQQDRMLLERGGPVQRIDLTLESGVHLSYPGMAGLAKDFDGRKDPLYQRAKYSDGVVWGPPLRADSGDGVIVEAGTAVRDASGEVMGVLRFQLDVRIAVDLALDASEISQIESSLLVERTGNVLAQRSNPGGSAEADVLAMEDVRDAIRRGESGYVETAREGRPVLVTYQPLSTVDWYLVTIANVGKLEASKLGSATREGSVAARSQTNSASATAEPSRPPRRPVPKPVPSEAVAPPVETASAAPSVRALTGRLPTAQTAPTAPPNPFDPWKAYQKEKPK